VALLLNLGFVAQFGFEALTTHAPRANRRCPLTVFFTARLADGHGQAGLTRIRRMFVIKGEHFFV